MEPKEPIICIFPHADIEFGGSTGDLRVFLAEVLPEREYSNHYGLHWEVKDHNRNVYDGAKEGRRDLFPVPTTKLVKGSKVYFRYKGEIIGDGYVEKLIWNDDFGDWDSEVYPVIVKFKKNTVRVFPHGALTKEVWRKLVSDKTRRTNDRAYPVITEEEDKNLQNRVTQSVRKYVSMFNL